MHTADHTSGGLRFPILQGVLPVQATQLPAEVLAGLTFLSDVERAAVVTSKIVKGKRAQELGKRTQELAAARNSAEERR